MSYPQQPQNPHQPPQNVPYGPPPPQGYPMPPPGVPGPYGPPQQPMAPAGPYVVPPRPFNHGAWLIWDLLSCGTLAPVHLLVWALHSRKSTVVMPDGTRVKR